MSQLGGSLRAWTAGDMGGLRCLSPLPNSLSAFASSRACEAWGLYFVIDSTSVARAFSTRSKRTSTILSIVTSVPWAPHTVFMQLPRGSPSGKVAACRGVKEAEPELSCELRSREQAAVPDRTPLQARAAAGDARGARDWRLRHEKPNSRLDPVWRTRVHHWHPVAVATFLTSSTTLRKAEQTHSTPRDTAHKMFPVGPAPPDHHCLPVH